MRFGDLPSNSILISLRCIMRSFFNWFSISSFLALPSFSSVLIPQPIVAGCDGDGRGRRVRLRVGNEKEVDESKRL